MAWICNRPARSTCAFTDEGRFGLAIKMTEGGADQRLFRMSARALAAESLQFLVVNPEPTDRAPALQPNNPLHGVTLEKMVTRLVQYFGWEELGRIIRVRCFRFDPSVKSSLAFLRKTPWARQKVEELYLDVTRAQDGKWEE